MTTYEPHAETCGCALCTLARNLDTRPTYADIWTGNPDTDKHWNKEQR